MVFFPFIKVWWRNLSINFFVWMASLCHCLQNVYKVVMIRIRRMILIRNFSGSSSSRALMVEKAGGSDGLLVRVVSGGQRLRAKRIQHSGLSFPISGLSLAISHQGTHRIEKSTWTMWKSPNKCLIGGNIQIIGKLVMTSVNKEKGIFIQGVFFSLVPP